MTGFKQSLLLLVLLALALPSFAQTQTASVAATATLQEAYIPLPGGGKAIYGPAGTQTYYQRQDGMGSVRIISTPTKTIGSSVGIAPFGEDYDADLPNGLIDMQFAGMGQEDATAGGISAGYGGMYVTPNRNYSAVQGRWLSPDPISGDNAYKYADNAPIIRSDSSGLQDGGDPDECDYGCISFDGGLGQDWSYDPGIDFGDFGFAGDVAGPGWYGISDALYSPGGGRLYPSLVTPYAVITLVYRPSLNSGLDRLPEALANMSINTVMTPIHMWKFYRGAWKSGHFIKTWWDAIGCHPGEICQGIVMPVEVSISNITREPFAHPLIKYTKGIYTAAEIPEQWTQALSSPNIYSNPEYVKQLGIVKGQPLQWAREWQAAGKELPYGFSDYYEPIDRTGMVRNSNHWWAPGKGNWTLESEQYMLAHPEFMEAVDNGSMYIFNRQISGFARYDSLIVPEKYLVMMPK